MMVVERGGDVKFWTFAGGRGLPKSNKCERGGGGGRVEILVFLWERNNLMTPQITCRLMVFWIYKNPCSFRKNIFACLFSVHNSVQSHGQELVMSTPWASMLNETTFRDLILKWLEKHLSKLNFIKHTCLWRVNLLYHVILREVFL